MTALRRALVGSRATGTVDAHDRTLARLLLLTAGCAAGYRLLATVTSLAPRAWARGAVQTELLVLLVVFTAVNVGLMHMLWTRIVRGRQMALGWIVLDSVVMAAFVTGVRALTSNEASVFLGLAITGGTVVLWTSCRGAVAGAIACLVAFATLVGWVSATQVSAWAVLLVLLSHYVAALAMVAIFRGILRDGVRDSGELGERFERARTRRMIHDTALQTLEAIALTASTPHPEGGGQAMHRVAEMASAEARQLRSALNTRDGEEADVLSALRAALNVGRAQGMNVGFEAGEVDEVNLAPGALAALSGAVREALTNVAKHAGPADVDMDTVLRGGYLEVSVTDNGVGFDADVEQPGFGLRESIHGRLAAVGGGALVHSDPGLGTHVRLWVPVETAGEPSALSWPRLPWWSAQPDPEIPAQRAPMDSATGIDGDVSV